MQKDSFQLLDLAAVGAPPHHELVAVGLDPHAVGHQREGEPTGEGGKQLDPSTGHHRFHGSAALNPTRVGRDAGRIADEVISHLAGLVGAEVHVTLEIEATIPSGAPDHVVRIVTENCTTLKFTTQGFEDE